MSKTNKALLYNFLSFAILFFGFRYLIVNFTGLDGRFLISGAAALIATILAPKFQAVNTKDGEKLFAKFLFLKGIKEID
jgi:hypothetical protein